MTISQYANLFFLLLSAVICSWVERARRLSSKAASPLCPIHDGSVTFRLLQARPEGSAAQSLA